MSRNDGDQAGLAFFFGANVVEKRPPPVTDVGPHDHKRIKLDVSSLSRATEKLKKVIQDAFLRRSVKLSLKPYTGPAHRPHDGYFFWRGMPPLEQPPQFNYEQFVDECIPSDFRFKKLFPADADVGKRSRYRDMRTEDELRELYRDWAFDMKENTAALGNCEGQEFYQELVRNLDMDHIEDLDAKHAVFKQAKDLARWEYKYLDNDGDTKGLVRFIQERGENHVFGGCKEAKEKYGYLLMECKNGDKS